MEAPNSTVEARIHPRMSSQTVDFFDYNQRVATSVIMGVIFIFGVVGNSLVLLAVAVSRKLQTTTNAFVVSLSLTDFLTCLVLPFQISGLVSRAGWPLPDGLCKLVGGIAILSVVSSSITLAEIAVNRLVLITVDRGKYDRVFCRRNVALMVGFTWLFPLLTMVLPPAIGYGNIGYTEKYKLCLMDGDHDYALIYEIGIAFIQLTCFILIVACYGLIYRFLHRNMFFSRSPPMRCRNDGNVTSNGGNVSRVAPTSQLESVELSKSQATTSNDKQVADGRKVPERGAKLPSKREVQITRNLFYVVVAFFVFIMPYAVAVVIPNSGRALVYLGILLLASSIINPIIYGFNHPHFRVVFRLLLRCDFQRIPEPAAFVRALQRN